MLSFKPCKLAVKGSYEKTDSMHVFQIEKKKTFFKRLTIWIPKDSTPDQKLLPLLYTSLFL